MVFYKRLVSITNVLWSYTWKLFVPLLILLGFGQGYFLYNNFKNATFQNQYWYGADENIELHPWSLRFEEYLARSYVKDIFTVALIITIIILISVSLRQKLVSKTEYTYLRLPVSKYTWFFTNAFFASSILVILLAFQFIIILFGYQMYLHFVPEEAVMNQGLFLAFARWDFLNKFFPIINPYKVVTGLLYLIHSGILIAYVNVMVLLKSNRRSVLLAGLFPFLFSNYQDISGFIFVIVMLVIIDLWIILSYPLMLKGLEEEGNKDG